MAWKGLTLTMDGQSVLNNAQISNRMNIKSIVVGDGNAPEDFRTLKNLVNQLFEITDLKIETSDGQCTITADFPKVNYDYTFREIGVIVTTDDEEKLYVYDNCGADAQRIVSSTGVELTRKRIRLSLDISDVADITVSNPSILYVAYDDFTNHVENTAIHITASERENWNATADLLNAITAGGAITEVQIVDALPADAASHPTTFYWVRG